MWLQIGKIIWSIIYRQRRAGICSNVAEPHEGQAEQLCVVLYERSFYVNALINQIQGAYIVTVQNMPKLVRVNSIIVISISFCTQC